jgi:Ankyrin repeats (3 copies)
MAGVDINDTGTLTTPLIGAMTTGQLEVVKALLSYRQLDVNRREAAYGSSPLEVAISLYSSELLLLLVAHEDIDLRVRNPLTGLTPIAQARRLQAVDDDDQKKYEKIIEIIALLEKYLWHIEEVQQ